MQPAGSALELERQLEAEYQLSKQAQVQGRRDASGPGSPKGGARVGRRDPRAERAFYKKQLLPKRTRKLGVMEDAEKVERHPMVHDMTFLRSDDVYWLQRRAAMLDSAGLADRSIAERAHTRVATPACSESSASTAASRTSQQRKTFASHHACEKAKSAVPSLHLRS